MRERVVGEATASGVTAAELSRRRRRTLSVMARRGPMMGTAEAVTVATNCGANETNARITVIVFQEIGDTAAALSARVIGHDCLRI